MTVESVGVGGVRGRKIRKPVKKQTLLALMVNFSSLAPSMSLGFSAIAIPPLMDLQNPQALTVEQASWFASIASLVTPLGCFISGPISDKFGRRSAFFAINIVSFIGWLTLAGASHLPKHQFPILLIGRMLTGLSTGLSSMPPNVYMAEVACSKMRSVFTTWSSISFSLGVLIVYILGYILKDSWGTVALITTLFPCVGMFFSVFLIPESPVWLIAKNRYDEAKVNMCKLYNVKNYVGEVQEEVETLVRNQAKAKLGSSNKKTIWTHLMKKIKYFRQPTCYKPLLLISIYFFFQQFTGTFVIVFYGINIVQEAGITLDPYATIVIIGATRFVAAILLSFISRVMGRKPLSIISGVGMSVCMLLLATYVLFQGTFSPNWMILPILLLTGYFFTSTLGFLTLPFAMAAEMFPARVRGTASGLTSCLAYVFNFIVVKSYEDMMKLMHRHGVFYFYGGMAVLGTLYVIFFLPETKGKSLQEIEEYFERKKPRDEVKALNE